MTGDGDGCEDDYLIEEDEVKPDEIYEDEIKPECKYICSFYSFSFPLDTYYSFILIFDCLTMTYM